MVRVLLALCLVTGSQFLPGIEGNGFLGLTRVEAQVQFRTPANNATIPATIAPGPFKAPAAAPLQIQPGTAPAMPVNSAPPTVVPQSEVPSVLQRGLQLERDRRWGEALTLYEDALRQYPRDSSLEQRFSLARVHYDLTRRYADASFRDTLNRLTLNETLDLYGEVLIKVQSHYVHAPDWQQLADHGTMCFDLALSDPVFVERNLSGMPTARIDRFRRDMRSRLEARNITTRVDSRQQARELASFTARFANEQLGLRESATVLEYICGATNALDSYSTFLTAGQLNEVYSQIEGNFVGLGVELKSIENALLIVKTITGSPAERAGIRSGDRIVAVDGRTVQELSTDQAANMLQGQEGTTVQVTITSPGQLPRVISVRREQVEVPSVDNVKIIDSAFGIGYLKLTTFQKTTSRDLDAALWKLHREGMRSLIMDLRGNPGGLLTTSVEVVDKFVERGVIVSTRGRSTQEDFTYTAREAGTWHVPLVVLIDGDSASASEIFAGAIRDHQRGTIVGARSYGKGSVQGIFPLNISGSGLRLTTAKFYSPKGLGYSQVGVSPDVPVQPVARHLVARPQVNEDAATSSFAADSQLATPEADAALEAATGVARRQLARR
jgi:carboxyl-terminal processing protease